MHAQYDADVPVIGAGAGGLTAAAYLAAAGKRVIVVDAGPRPGGHSTVFERDGYEFDIGLHFIGTDADGSVGTGPDPRAGRPGRRRSTAPTGAVPAVPRWR